MEKEEKRPLERTVALQYKQPFFWPTGKRGRIMDIGIKRQVAVAAVEAGKVGKQRLYILHFPDAVFVGGLEIFVVAVAKSRADGHPGKIQKKEYKKFSVHF